ncbi:MAG: diguanylate cyclase [Myxococcota bacterium]
MGDTPPDSSSSFELKVIFLREMATGYRQARSAEERLLRDPGDGRALAELHDFFHRIAGFAAQVDLRLLGRVAGVCERAIDAVHAGELVPGVTTVRLLAEGLEAVADVLEQHGTGPSERPPLPRQSSVEGLAVSDAAGEGRQLPKVLVVDDDEFSAALIDHTLRNAGFMSSHCQDPAQAIERVAQELPDLIILDVMMPEMDGFELCRRVRRHPAMRFTPILFVTRRGDVEQRVKGLEAGADDYIAKPFEPAELVARVRSHLQRLSALREMAIRDGLTRCYNHKFLKMRLEQEMARARRYDQSLSVAMLDIDHFKEVNDEHGHGAGDQVLVHLADVIHAAVRSTDVVARYGGEEFTVLMVHAGAAEATLVGNRIRERIAAHRFEVGPEVEALPSLTVSVGIAEWTPDDTVASLIERADQALYEVKRTGRNAVRVADPDGP